MARRKVLDPLGSQQWKTQRAELPEDLWQPLYDRTNIATSVPSESTFFSVPKGQSATLVTGESSGSKTKTFRDTNIETANVIPSKMHVIVGVSLGYSHVTKDDINNLTDRDLIRDNTYFRLRIIDKDILYLPAMAIPDLNPISAATTTLTGVSGVASQGGGGFGIRMYKLPVKLTINPYENFTCSLNNDGTVTLNNTLDVVCVLQGFMRRPT